MDRVAKNVEALSDFDVDLYHPCLCQAVVEHTLDSGALSDLDDVWDILQWRKNDGEIAPTAEHEPLHADLLYIAHIKFADIVTSDLPFCPGLGNTTAITKSTTTNVRRNGLLT